MGEVVRCEAWDLIGEHSDKIEGASHLARIVGGRVWWEAADLARSGRIRLGRIEPGATLAEGLHVIVRYVDPETEMELIEWEEVRGELV